MPRAGGFAGAEVLRGESGKPARHGGQRGQNEGIELDSRYISREYRGTVAVDYRLDYEVTDGNETLLKHARYGDVTHLPQKHDGESFGFALRAQFTQFDEQGEYTGESRDALREESSPRETRNAQRDRHREYEVERDVRDARRDKEIKRRARIAQSGEYARADVVQQNEQKAAYINIKVEKRIVHYVGGGIEQTHNGFTRSDSGYRKHDAYHGNGYHYRGHARLNVAHAFFAEKPAYYHRATEVTAQSYRREYHRNGIGSAYRGERAFAEHSSRYYTVRHIVKLLEYRAYEKRQAERPQHPGRFTYRQILYHKYLFTFYP